MHLLGLVSLYDKPANQRSNGSEEREREREREREKKKHNKSIKCSIYYIEKRFVFPLLAALASSM
jgi:uncharacterized Fe-S cluster-containing protein